MNQAVAEKSSGAPVPALLARWPVATLLLLCVLAWIPGFFALPPLDRDESRFAQASKQMIETGNYVDIRYSVGPRYKKPVGIYWLQAASTLAFSKPPYNQIWTYRLPSLIGGFIAVLLAYWCARALAPPEIALIAAALIGFTVGLTAETRIAKTDAVLLGTVLGSQALLLRAYLAARLNKAPPSFWVAMGGWAAFAAGILIKGPIIIAVLAVTVIAISLWDRDWTWIKSIHWGWGLLLTAVLVLPWGLAIAFATHGEFYEQALGHDFAAKILGGQETHGAPPGYYLLLASVTLWPATLFALPGVGSGIALRRDPAIRYLLAWAGAAWLMFEIVPTKLPHYILPAYPAVAFLGALWATRPANPEEPRWEKVLRYLAGLQFALGVAAFTIAPILLPKYFGEGIDPWLVLGACFGGALGIAAVILFVGRRTWLASILAVAAAVTFYPLIGRGVAAKVDQIWMSPKAAALVAKYEKPHDPPVVLGGYVEPSLVFLLGTQTQIQNGIRAADIAAQQGGLALIEDHEQRKFLTELARVHAEARPLDGVSGFNYSRGRREHITVYRVTPAPRIMEPPSE
ncbi:MAG: glycosyltransferase family 39 protein [Proteobacteria bacterium]|nr:glycosyltransferase family 39 protein [Pseudomonadota bacterium]